MLNSNAHPLPPTAGGWCRKCQVDHHLEQGPARREAETLIQELRTSERIDFPSHTTAPDPRFSTNYLFGKALGQMFGVLVCEDDRGKVEVLRAFSGQYNSHWLVEGWVPPLFDVPAHEQIMTPGDILIKKLGRQIQATVPDSEEHRRLKQERKQLSRSIMTDLHNLYELRNFRAETSPLTKFFDNTNGPPTGAGDCCAPKLLHHAACHNLRPIGLAEFYWGSTNRAGTCLHGRFYTACAAKCQPILGFLLCGAGP